MVSLAIEHNGLYDKPPVRILFVPAGGITEADQLSPADTFPRCQEALKLWATKKYDFLLLSGGIFNPLKIQTRPAAELMRRWFFNNGVAMHKIIIENESRDTFEGIAFSLRILKNRGTHNFQLHAVSHWQHIMRIKLTCKLVYGEEVICCPVNYRVSILTWLVGWLHILYHLIDRKGQGYFAKRNRENRSRKV